MNMRRTVCTALALAISLTAVCLNLTRTTESAVAITTATEGKYSMTCPNGVKVGIKGASAGWYAGPDESHSFTEVTVVRQGNNSFITCEYGTSGKYALSRIATGYDCRAVALGSRDVVCTPRPKAPIKIK
jgi:hypothetical protein